MNRCTQQRNHTHTELRNFLQSNPHPNIPHRDCKSKQEHVGSGLSDFGVVTFIHFDHPFAFRVLGGVCAQTAPKARRVSLVKMSKRLKLQTQSYEVAEFERTSHQKREMLWRHTINPLGGHDKKAGSRQVETSITLMGHGVVHTTREYTEFS